MYAGTIRFCTSKVLKTNKYSEKHVIDREHNILQVAFFVRVRVFVFFIVWTLAKSRLASQPPTPRRNTSGAHSLQRDRVVAHVHFEPSCSTRCVYALRDMSHFLSRFLHIIGIVAIWPPPHVPFPPVQAASRLKIKVSPSPSLRVRHDAIITKWPSFGEVVKIWLLAGNRRWSSIMVTLHPKSRSPAVELLPPWPHISTMAMNCVTSVAVSPPLIRVRESRAWLFAPSRETKLLFLILIALVLGVPSQSEHMFCKNSRPSARMISYSLEVEKQRRNETTKGVNMRFELTP